jgi:hypothetical protein
LIAASEKICARTPAPWAAWIHQIHAAQGVSGSNTMVVVFVVELFCVLQSCLFVVAHRMKTSTKQQP